MTSGIILAIVFVLLDVVIIGAVMTGVRHSATAALTKFPPQIPADDSAFRARQSIGIGWLNLGGGFDIAVDNAAIHLEPAFLGRLFKLPAASIPWSQATVQVRWTGAAVRAGGEVFRVPKWTIEEGKRRGVVADGSRVPR